MANDLITSLGIHHPILQAPMAGGGDTPQLVAAVSSAGGLGCFGAAYSSPQQIAEYAARVRDLTSHPFGINLFAPSASTRETTEENVSKATERLAMFYTELGLEPPTSLPDRAYTFEQQLDAAVETGAILLSFTFGALSEEDVVKANNKGMLVAGTATTVEEAQFLERRGVDAIIAQGGEAGGHRGTFNGPVESSLIGTMALVPQIRDAVKIPVIASGGIMDGRGIAAAMCLGASAVQMGTAFLACNESGIGDSYREALLHAHEDHLVLTNAFSGRYARGIDNRFTREMHDASDVLPFPLQNALTRPIRNEAAKRGDAQMLSLWAGQGVRMAKRRSACHLMRDLIHDTEETLRRARDVAAWIGEDATQTSCPD